MLNDLLAYRELIPHSLGWHERICEGFLPASVKALAKGLQVAPDDICQLIGLPLSRLEHDSRKIRLSPEQSDYLYRIAVAFSNLYLALKSADACCSWLRTAQPLLKDRIPVLLLATYQGAVYVFTAIERIPAVQAKVTPSEVEVAVPAETEEDLAV